MKKLFFSMIVMVLAFLPVVPLAVLAQDMAVQNASKVDEPQFFQTLNDVPLMPGLYEMAEESLVFDKPGGRIAQSAAASQDVKMQEIADFYGQTLPQMGWQPLGTNSFVRQDEKLTMQLENQSGYNIVRIMVAPR